jgi:oxygen-dependent protoporphyrinogen oxidase
VKRVVVIGAGIAGLSAARAAWELGGSVPGGLEVLVLEREQEVGGKARSRREGPWLFETGPGAIQGSEPALDRMIQAAGLEGVQLHSAPEAARRFMYRGGKLREVHAAPLALARSGILSPLGLLRLACEPFVPVRRESRGAATSARPEESVHAFARRRIGEEAAQRLVAPIVTGVYAGDPDRLSLPAAFPRMAELETRYGGLIRGMRKLATMPGERRGPGSAPLTSFPDGLQQLARTLAATSRFETRCGVRATSLARAPREVGGWTIAIEGGEPLRADAVVLAGEAWAMAEFVRAAVPELATELGAIAHPPVAVVGLGYAPEQARTVPRAFGALVARGEPLGLLGCLWDSHVFAGRAPAGHLFVRCMYGGMLEPAAARREEPALVAAARADMRMLFGIEAAPLYAGVARWERAIPQYELGHLERRARVAAIIERSFGLYLCGNSMDGVAFPRAAASGVSAGERAARALAQR